MPMSRPPPPAEPSILERLRHHLDVLKLPHILKQLDDYSAWGARDKPAPNALLERILGEEVTLRGEQRIERRIATLVLKERKTLEAFQWDFQPELDKALVLEAANLQDDLCAGLADGSCLTRLKKWCGAEVAGDR